MNRRGLYAALLLLINVVIVNKLFWLDYSAYVLNNEGTFMAIARIMAAHPFDWVWWPYWDLGLPFQNTYLPFLHMLVALVIRVTNCGAASSFHIVTGLLYCIGPVGVFLMASVISGRQLASFLAALAYSLVSPSAILSPVIRTDVGGLWNLRRLHVLVYYGEGPQTAALALLPFAILLLYLAITRRTIGLCIAAGLSICAVTLSNAFGAVTLAMAILCMLITIELPRFRRNLGIVAAIGILSYCFVSSWLPPSLIRAIRMNSPTVDGDYRYTQRDYLGLLALIAVFAVLCWVLRRMKLPPYLQFFCLFAFLVSTIALLGLQPKINILPQPHRYHVGMDLALCVAVALAIAWLLDRAPFTARAVVVALVIIVCARQLIHNQRYARRLIRGIDITETVEYRTALWMDEHLKGQRAFISGSNTFLYNVFTDNPQFHGGHDPNLPNFLQRIAVFVIYSGMNAGDRDAEISTLWLKAFGAQAITVSGPTGKEYYKPFAHPEKFEGVLPVLWREGGDTIYGVPNRSPSIAHVVPRSSIATRTPIHGLDVDPLIPYVTALDNPAYPLATLTWHNQHSARVDTTLSAGDVISLQIASVPGWRATVNGVAKPVSRDGLGLMVIDAGCQGACSVELDYTGGIELLATRILSGSAFAIALALWFFARARSLKI